MGERPTGTVTFLFTDIEGSTRLLHDLAPKRTPPCSTNTEGSLRKAFAAFGGDEIDSQGDAFFTGFARPRDAVLAAGDGKLALAEHVWPDGRELRVRMGIHTAEATATAEGYVGAGIQSRRRGSARRATAGRSNLPHDARPGRRRRRGVRLRGPRRAPAQRPDRAAAPVSVGLEGLPERFPPLRTLENRPTNCRCSRRHSWGEPARSPKWSSSCAGRYPGGHPHRTRRLREDPARAPRRGGAVEDFPHGVFFVTLAAIADPELVLPQIAQTLGVNESAGQCSRRTWPKGPASAHRQPRAGSRRRALARARCSPRPAAVKLLLTSREALHVAAERVYPVPPLGLPDTARLPKLSTLSQYEAVALFIERAKAASPTSR